MRDRAREAGRARGSWRRVEQVRTSDIDTTGDKTEEVKMGIVVLTPHLIYNYKTITTPI